MLIILSRSTETLDIDVKANGNGPNTPQWVTDAIAEDPKLEEPVAIKTHCQSLSVFDEMPFGGAICFVSVWKDVSSLVSSFL